MDRFNEYHLLNFKIQKKKIIVWYLQMFRVMQNIITLRGLLNTILAIHNHGKHFKYVILKDMYIENVQTQSQYH